MAAVIPPCSEAGFTRTTGVKRGAAWTTVEIHGRERRTLTPEGLYGRREMTELIRRTPILGASRGAIDRAMRSLGLAGIRRAD